jgi:ParB-like chromosome segregation protein Spo0J
MAVQIQDILALLPELFSGVQSLPLKNVRPDPENPGPPLTDQAIQELADNIAARGLVNPIKVQGDKANLFAEGVQPHPDNPRLALAGSPMEPAQPKNGPQLEASVQVDGRPWKVEDFNWVILGGERRYRAADRLHWTTIPGFILNPTEEEAVEINYLDNDVRDRGWWAGYQSIEKLIKANPTLTQRQVGTRLKMDSGRINRALSLLPLLNPDARGLIVANCNNSNKGIWGISESAVLRLADLGPESTLKPGVKKAGDDSRRLWPYPAIPAETQDRIRRTLAVAIDEQMTEAGVKGLVRWVQDGGDPEKYRAKEVPVPNQDAASNPDKEPYDRIPFSANSKHPKIMTVPVARVRMHPILDKVFSFSPTKGIRLERQALAMQATGKAAEVWVRTLSEAEKKADPDHDYELFDRIYSLKGAQRLGWTELDAWVYDIDQAESLRLHHFVRNYSTPLTWIETYQWIENQLRDGTEKSLAHAAIIHQLDPALVQEVFPILKLLNDSAREAIAQSEHGFNSTGYKFTPQMVFSLAPLEKISEDLPKTQSVVEKVVKLAIEHQMWKGLDELVDWVLDGNDPDEYFEKEA